MLVSVEIEKKVRTDQRFQDQAHRSRSVDSDKIYKCLFDNYRIDPKR